MNVNEAKDYLHNRYKYVFKEMKFPSIYERKELGYDHILIQDRKSTRLNSSHQIILYAVFCLKKKILLNHQRASRIYMFSYAHCIFILQRKSETYSICYYHI